MKPAGSSEGHDTAIRKLPKEATFAASGNFALKTEPEGPERKDYIKAQIYGFVQPN